MKGYFKNLRNIIFGDYDQFAEFPLDNQKMVDTFAQASLPAFGYYFLILTSSIIATLGLISNSSATIIGAMIIAPLMNPIITLAFGLTVSNKPDCSWLFDVDIRSSSRNRYCLPVQ